MVVRLFARLFAVAGLLFAFSAPLPAVAQTNPFKNVDCGNAADSTVCQTRRETADPLTGPDGVLARATNIIATIAGIVAVIFIVLGGLKYVTSNGEAAEISKAKETIIYALVGLILIVLARAIISTIINKV